MEEVVNTGGLKEIKYPKGYKPDRDIELEENIDRAYEKYYARRKRRRIFLTIAIIILLSSLVKYYFL